MLNKVQLIGFLGGDPEVRYTNDSEAIRDLIRREQERSAEIESIRQALIEGEQSGEPEPFDFAAFKQRKAAQYG